MSKRLWQCSGLFGIAWLACSVSAIGQVAQAQQGAGCTAEGRRVVARRWDVVLGKGWDLVEDCAHPERPARLIASASADATDMGRVGRTIGQAEPVAAALSPLLVRAGDSVKLWQQTENVRIEMVGVVEQSARMGQHVVVRFTRQSDDGGLTVKRIDGTVRGAGDVEMGQ
jgi:hypothetical protein